jgi:hypothetical protein
MNETMGHSTSLGYLFVSLLLLSLGVKLYENYCSVLTVLEKPPLLASKAGNLSVWFIRSLMMYGSIVGIWFVWGVWAALPAYAFKVIFSRGTLKYYHFKAVRKWACYYLDKLANEAKTNRQTLDEDQLKRQALLLAKTMVQKAMRNEW